VSVEEQSTATARSAGRGGLAVLGAKVFFVLSGLVQQTILPHVIGLAGYGALSRVLALANIPNNVVVASSTQGVSRAVARSRGHAEDAWRATMRVHVPLAILLAAAFAGLAPLLAAFEGASHIALPLALMALVLFFYGVYAPLIGLLNGRAQWSRQAALDMTFAVLRTTGLLGVGWLFVRAGGSGVVGATVGFVVAAGLIVPIAMGWARIGRAAPRTDRSPTDPAVPRPLGYIGELLPLAGAQFFTNAVMQVDITLLGRFLSRGALASGLTGAAAAAAADEWVAVYRACQLFAFLPYQLLLSITQVLFPMLARAHAERDPLAVRRYVERGARLAVVACGMMVAVIAAMPGSVLGFAYGSVVAERGAGALRILALGQGAYTMLAIATTVLASLGRERTAAIITFGALVGVSSLCALLAPAAAFGGAQLQATALATSLALAATLVVAGVVVRGQTGGFVPVGTMLRVGLALATLIGLGSMLPRLGRLLTPVAAVAVALGYLVVLVMLRELTREDLAMVRSLRRRS
jgi:stage V sporulation protein B